LGEYGPVVVAVQDSTLACHSSALASYAAALAVAPCLRAMSAAVIRPAISVAIVFGLQPLRFSQRSCSVWGPFWTMKSAAFSTCRQSAADVRPSHQASTTGSAVSSSWSDVQYSCPFTRVFCHHEPSSFWTSHR
jgi:hypothetical protein